ncbi:ABC transporter permease [Sphingobium baderi]|uniref:ABC transporter permease n=1 Tax=Sphingobium baderi TaxID=1332080 RepID=UPI002B4093C6|nr:ABC transporter permease [Sphingobium baderi]WRD75609.1 ABC transporter permease [Sphingobium baderi]
MKDMMRSAMVIARRDFSAVIFTRTFLFFLLGPLLPILIGMAFGGLSEKISNDSLRPAMGLSMPPAQAARMLDAREAIARRIGADHISALKAAPWPVDPQQLLARSDAGYAAVVSGSVDRLVLTGQRADIARLEGDVRLIASAAEMRATLPEVRVERNPVALSASGQAQARLTTGRAAQILMFLLTMLLAGMVLSNMVEEKNNKVIEILAAAVPIDAVFLGKLVAMLSMSFIGIFFWAVCALAGMGLLAGPGFALPTPAVGWPVFLLLALLYFAMAYCLLGSLFLGIGAQAATVREVQTLNMPVTMGQMVVFFFATYAVDHMGSAPEIAAAVFPLSSPFAMIARAAQDAALWPHVLALAWQALWVALIIRMGVWLFRRHVLHSGTKRPLFRRRSPPAS